MEGFQSFGLREEFLRGGDDDHHLVVAVLVQVLIGDVVDIFRYRERCSREWLARPRRVECGADVVESGHASCLIVDGNSVHLLQVSHVEIQVARLSFVVGIGFLCRISGFLLAVQHDAARSRTTQTDYHTDVTRGIEPGSFDSVAFRRTCVDGFVVEKVATTFKPGKLFFLDERVIVVVRGVEGADESGTIYRQWFGVAFCDEVVAVVGAVVTRTGLYGLAGVGNWTIGIEQTFAVYRACGHFHEVVGLHQIVGRQFLGLQVAAVAVDFYLAQAAEAGSLHQGFRQLVDSRLRHTDLRPLARGQQRVFGIATFLFAVGAGHGMPPPGCCCFRSLHIEHETHQFLHFLIAANQWREADAEHTALAVDGHHGSHLRQFRQFVGGDGFVSGNVGLIHVHELRILNADGVHRVGIVVAHRQHIAEIGEQRVDLHLLGREVEETALRRRPLATGKERDGCDCSDCLHCHDS